MKIDKNTLLKVSLYVGFGLVILGVFAKISHWKGADAIIIIGFVVTLIYTMTQYSINYTNNVKIQPTKVIRDITIYSSFIIGLTILVYATYPKTVSLQSPALLYSLCGIATLIFVMSVLNEVLSSRRINLSEKIMWTICIILLTPLTGFVYLLAGRKRVLPILE